MEECCELCEKRAMMYCDSDQAKLCWDCDEKVHSANFLVARHTRVLLCHLCHSPTPWKASGPKLTPTVSLCHCCVANRDPRFQHLVDDDHRDYVDDDGEYSSDADSDHVYDDDDDDGEEEEEEEDEDEDGENQVVPLSSASASSSPPHAAGFALKRLRDNSFSVDSDTQDARGCSSSDMLSAAALPSSDESTIMSVSRPLKERRFNQRNH